MKFKKVLLGEVCEISSSKRIFAKEYRPIGIPFYRGKEIIEKSKGNKVTTELFISKERFEEIKKKNDVPRRGDILLTSVGTLGVPWLVDEENFYFKDGNLTWLRSKTGLDHRYLFLWLNSPEAKRQVDSMCIGSTQKALTIETLRKFSISLPSVEIQERIANIMYSVANKISLNQNINDNLEQQAQALFANYYEHTDNETCFTDIIQILGGGTPKTGEISYWNGDIPFFTPKDVGTPYALNTEKSITESGLAHCNSKLYPVNTVFVTARGTVGKVGLAGVPMAMNQSCYALVGKDINQLLVYFYTIKVVERLKHKASGAVFDAITTRDFESERIKILTSETSIAFLSVAEPIFQQILCNSIENQRLSALRDALLPRLMSGEIDVSDIKI